MSITTHSNETIRNVILHCQELSNSGNHTPTLENITSVVSKIRALQIDTLQMVKRSHFLALWSRIGTYDDNLLNELAYGNNRKFFEYWYHAACIIPVEEFAYRIPAMKKHFRKETKRWRNWPNEKNNAKVINETLNKIKLEGPMKASDFNDTKYTPGSWWNWKPSKRALEYLNDSGMTVVVDRINFQRVYGLTELNIPEKFRDTNYTDQDCLNHDLEMSLKATGICRPSQVGNYTHTKQGLSNPIVKEMIRSGRAVEITGLDKSKKEIGLLIHKDNLHLLELAQDGVLNADRTTFLSPFDNIFWAKGRDKEIFSFTQVLECYKPKNQRKWGYFCLPILYKGTLIGRFDPKLDRKTGTMIIRSMHLEPDVIPDEQMLFEVAKSMREFLSFHDANSITFENAGNGEFRNLLQKAL